MKQKKVFLLSEQCTHDIETNNSASKKKNMSFRKSSHTLLLGLALIYCIAFGAVMYKLEEYDGALQTVDET